MKRREPVVLLVLGAAALLLSGIAPKERFTWFLEVAPIFIAVPILLATYRRFPLTPLAYRLIFVHALILMVGGHYTYAEVPLGFWMQKLLGFARNPYDRIGHLAQGFVPAILVREVLRRKDARCPTTAGSSSWSPACAWRSQRLLRVRRVGNGRRDGLEGATLFSGTQGDPWDTQWDMLCALIGALAAQLLLGRTHERQIAALSATRAPGSA